MGQLASAGALPRIDSRSLHRLEKHFISPEVYRRDDVAFRQGRLASLVSKEIIPRLLRVQAGVGAVVPPGGTSPEVLTPNDADIATLANIVLGSDLEAAVGYLTVLRERGLEMETLFLELLEPTARYLGEMWDQDECDFIDVTLGVARLQKLLAAFNDTHELPDLDARRHVLMAVTPGEQHSFGVAMVSKFLSAAGWDVCTDVSGSAEQIADLAKGRWFAVAGLTAGSDRQLDSLKSTIIDIRKHSRNPAIGILVGGPMFTADPALASEVGADATALNAPAAVLVAQKLFDLRCPDWGDAVQ